MKKISITLFCSILFSSPLLATPYDHIHLTATSAEEAVSWYVKHFGGTPSRFRGSNDPELPIDRVMYGDIAVIFFDREPTGGSVGTGTDHFGFSMENVAEVVANVVADGGTQLGDLVEFSGMQIGFVEDPWGTKLEIIDDPELRGVHHLHLSSPDPAATLEWYGTMFGGENIQWKGAAPALDYGNVILLVAQAQGELDPTGGRAFDHLGWRFDNLESGATELKSKGATFSMEPRDYRGIRISFVEGPDGVRIEVVGN